MENNEINIVLFDGVCILCNNTVQFILDRDIKAIFRFSSLQSDAGRLLISQTVLPAGSRNFLVYISGKRIYIKSTAVLRILRRLGGGWQLFFVLIIIPRFLRDLVYDFIAKRRYHFFGKKDSCMIPAPEYRDRFL